MSTENAARPRKPTRARGEGSVSLRADGRWMYRYQPIAGPRVQRYAATEEEARRKLREALVSRDRGLPVTSHTHTVSTWLGVWITSLDARIAIDEHAIRPNTRERYAWAIGRIRADRIARVKLHRLEPHHVLDAIARMRTDPDRPLSAVTASSVLHVLGLALDSALVSGHIGRNVARAPYVRGPKIERRSAGAPPTTAELRKLRAAMAGDELEALWMLLLDAGLRIGEALALRWRDVELPAGILHVRHTLHDGGRLGPPKSRARELYPLPLDHAVTAAIARRREARYPTHVRPAPDRFVFGRTPEGAPLSQRMANIRWDALVARAGIKRCRMHDLRHSFGTRGIEAGIPLAMLSRYMGHSSIKITADIYGHPELVAPGLAPLELTPQADTTTGRHRETVGDA